MTRYVDTPMVRINFVWNPNAVRGFIVAVGVLLLVLLVSMCTRIEPPEPYVIRNSTPIELLVFGDGDGTGARKGNLTREGAAQKGKESTNPLEDAQRASSSRGDASSDPSQSSTLIPVKDVGKDGTRKDGEAADRSIGRNDGSDQGTGLGWAGSGQGKGLGIGEVDWGGGGNRIVTNKPLPVFPPGTLNTEVKLRFRVQPDGTVSLVWPIRRGGNPAVDEAAMKALRQWRFNKIPNDIEMEGTITFVFKNS